MASPTLLYFRFSGRALAARVALFNAFGKDGWTNQTVGPTQFKKMKEASRPHWSPGADIQAAPMISENLPQLTLPNGTKVTQSTAIARWAAQQTLASTQQLPNHCVPDLYPKMVEDAILVDEAMNLVDQIVAFTPKDADSETRRLKRIQYSTEGFMNIAMRILEGRIASGPGPFLLGEKLSIADIYMKCPLADLILDKQFEHVEPSFLKNSFPLIYANHAAVLAHPLLQAFYREYKA